MKRCTNRAFTPSRSNTVMYNLATCELVCVVLQLLKRGVGLTTGTDSELITQLLALTPPGGEGDGQPDWLSRYYNCSVICHKLIRLTFVSFLVKHKVLQDIQLQFYSRTSLKGTLCADF